MAKADVIPTATYRLQFNKDWTFNQTREIVPYLKRLGISHVYASPIFKAPPESNHGYDVADHNELNPVLGSRADYDAMIAELREHGFAHRIEFAGVGLFRLLVNGFSDSGSRGLAKIFF